MNQPEWGKIPELMLNVVVINNLMEKLEQEKLKFELKNLIDRTMDNLKEIEILLEKSDMLRQEIK